MDVRCRCPIDQQAEQFGSAVVTARVHEPLAGVDLGAALSMKTAPAIDLFPRHPVKENGPSVGARGAA
jgi:hypothetical protein